MRAVQYDDYGDIDVLNVADSGIPAFSEDEVLIKVGAAALNPFDWKLRSGMLRDFFELEFPITPGREGCGEIVELGKKHDLTRILVGEVLATVRRGPGQPAD